MRIFETNHGVVIKVGENEHENDQLVKNSDQNYLWCHIDNQPSPHAVIESNNPDSDTINIALQLVKFFSKAKKANQTNMIMTKIKFVTPVSVKNPGLVRLTKAPRKRTIKTNFGMLRNLGVQI